jgi:hypothetical protein
MAIFVDYSEDGDFTDIDLFRLRETYRRDL